MCYYQLGTKKFKKNIFLIGLPTLNGRNTKKKTLFCGFHIVLVWKNNDTAGILSEEDTIDSEQDIGKFYIYTLFLNVQKICPS